MGRMMRAFTLVTAALFATAITGVSGQAARGNEPRELPPADYSGNQYVDSAGCVFLRAGLAGQTTWVPRVNRDRQPVCGYEPTSAAAPSGAAPAPDSAPAPSAATVAAAQPVAPQTVAEPAMPAPVKATPAKRKKAGKPLAPKSVALVHRKAVAKSATYCADRIAAAQRYLLSDGRRVTQCAEVNDAPAVGYLNGLAIPGLEVSDRAPSAAEIRRAETANQGAYRVSHANGQADHGGTGGDGAGAGSTTSAAGPYIQIGAFSQAANAERAIATLKGLGLPVSVAVAGRLKVILAGPFTSAADASDALTSVRRSGYRDAFPTRG